MKPILTLFFLFLSEYSLAYSSYKSDPNMSWQERGEFTGEVCNDTGELLLLHQSAIPFHPPSRYDHDTKLENWYKIKPGECSTFVESYLYAQTESGRFRWEHIPGTESKGMACVPLDCNSNPMLTCEKNWDRPSDSCPQGSRRASTFLLERKTRLRLNLDNAVRGPEVSLCLSKKEKALISKEKEAPSAFRISKNNMKKHEGILDEVEELKEKCFNPEIDSILNSIDIFKLSDEQMEVIAECDSVLAEQLRKDIVKKKEDAAKEAKELRKKAKDIQNRVAKTFRREKNYTNLKNDSAKLFGYLDLTYESLLEDGELDNHGRTLNKFLELKNAYVEDREDILGASAGFYNYYNLVSIYSSKMSSRFSKRDLGFKETQSFFGAEKVYASKMVVGILSDRSGYHLDSKDDDFERQMSTFIELDPVYGTKLKDELLKAKALKLWVGGFVQFFKTLADLNERALQEKREAERDKSLYEYAQNSVKATYEFAKYLNSPEFVRHMKQLPGKSVEAAKAIAENFKKLSPAAQKCMAMSLLPSIGDTMDIYEVTTGLNACTGEKLTDAERKFSMAATFIGSGPVMRKLAASLGWLKKGVKEIPASKVDEIVKDSEEIYNDLRGILGKRADVSRVFNSAKNLGIKSKEKFSRMTEWLKKPLIPGEAGSIHWKSDALVDLSTPARRNHILHGDATGGGHLFPGKPTKTIFPKDWNGDKIMHEVADIVTDPNLTWKQANGVPGTMYTKAGKPAKFEVVGVRDGVEIKVVFKPANSEFVTAHPISGPGVIKNP